MRHEHDAVGASRTCVQMPSHCNLRPERPQRSENVVSVLSVASVGHARREGAIGETEAAADRRHHPACDRRYLVEQRRKLTASGDKCEHIRRRGYRCDTGCAVEQCELAAEAPRAERRNGLIPDRAGRSRWRRFPALNALRTSVANQTYVPPARQSVGEFLDEWAETIRGTVEPSTMVSYRQQLRLHVKPHIGGIQLQKLDPASLNALYGRLREHLSAKTVRYVHSIIHRAFKDAVKWDRLVRNPADFADPPRAKDARPPEMQTWSAVEVGQFLGLVRGCRYRTAWLLIATTGVRRGECLGLRWKDIDFEGGRLSVRQTAQLVGHHVVIAPRTKTGPGRAIDLDPTTIAELRAHRVWQAQELLLLGIRPNGETLVFSRPDGTVYHPARFSREFTRTVERHPGFPRIPVHGLRHSWATIALASGIPNKVVAERLGHSSTAITDNLYSHVTPTMGADAAAKVAGLIFAGA